MTKIEELRIAICEAHEMLPEDSFSPTIEMSADDALTLAIFADESRRKINDINQIISSIIRSLEQLHDELKKFSTSHK